MGKEQACTMRYQDRSHSGLVYLESDHLLFRGDVRLKILFDRLTSVTADAGVLKVVFDRDEALFTLGPDAEVWARKILHPPSRISKLGLKPGMVVSLAGEFDADFLAEIADAGAHVGRLEQAHAIFLGAPRSSDLRALETMAPKLRPKAFIWIVYPKATAILEAAVLLAGRSAGLKDTKVAAFSKTQTALRFSNAGASRKGV